MVKIDSLQPVGGNLSYFYPWLINITKIIDLRHKVANI